MWSKGGKRGVSSIFVILFAAILSLSASALIETEKQEYVLGEDVIVHIDAVNYTVFVHAPEALYTYSGAQPGFFVYNPLSVGSYKLILQSSASAEETSFSVVSAPTADVLKTDKEEYSLDDQVLINTSLEGDYELSIETESLAYRYLGYLEDAITFIPRTVGRYLLKITRNGEVVAAKEFVVKDLRKQVKIRTDRLEYALGDSVELVFEGNVESLNVYYNNFSYEYRDKLGPRILITPKEEGSYVLEAVVDGVLERASFVVGSGKGSYVLWDVLPKKGTFAFDENPEFAFHFREKDGVQVQSFSTGKGTLDTGEGVVSAQIFDSENHELDVEPVIEENADGVAIRVENVRAFKPGWYKIKVVLEKNGETIVGEEWFKWGLIALNPNKGEYKVGDDAFLSMAVLNSQGHMVCDADVRLEITEPDGDVIVLSTPDDIKISPECSVYGVTSEPDYSAHYLVDEEGTYVLNMTAITYEGSLSLVQEFTAFPSLSYDVERVGPTRLFPAEDYTMTLNLLLDHDSKDDIIERVPSSFEILGGNYQSVTESGNEKLIRWKHNLKKGQQEGLFYTFNAPDVSPYLFLLGPLTIGSWAESRQWMLASDVVTVFYCRSLVACFGDNGGSCTCSEGNATDGTYFNAPNGVRTKNGNNAAIVVNLSDPGRIPGGSTIVSGTLWLNFGVTSGVDSCVIYYSTNGGSTWTTLNSSCISQTTNAAFSYDLSSLTATQLENLLVNITIREGSATNTFLRWDEINLSVDYAAPSSFSVTLNEPVHNATNRTVLFEYTPSSTNGYLNCSLWTNETSWSLKQYNATEVINGTRNNFTRTFSTDQVILWNVQCYNGQGNSTFAPGNFTLIIDTGGPQINIVSPPNDSTSASIFGVDYVFNVTDTLGEVRNCSLIVDGSIVSSLSQVSEGVNQTISYLSANGIHLWSINCTDQYGNVNGSERRRINISVPATEFSSRWYETSGTTDHNTSAIIFLNNSRDSVEGNATRTLDSAEVYTFVNATSPFFGSEGAYVPAGQTVTFSAAIPIVSNNNRARITWKLYVKNTSGDSLICQFGNDGTTGVLITSTGTFSASNTTCLSNARKFEPLDRFFLQVNIYDDHANTVTVTHAWDASHDSYFDVGQLYTLGKLRTELISPTAAQSLFTGDRVNVTCQFNCSIGYCINTNIVLQYNTSATDWVNISGSGNLILASGSVNPYSLGNVTTATNTTNFTIQANAVSTQNLRCLGLSSYSWNDSAIQRRVVVNPAAAAPVISLLSPTNFTYFTIPNATLSYNVSDDNDNVFNCSLFLNGLFNQTNKSFVSETLVNNFTATGLVDGGYNWSVTCFDDTGLNSSAGNWSFYIDTKIPNVDLVFPADGATITSAITNLNWTARDNLDVSLTCNVTVDGTVRTSNFEASNGTTVNTTVSSLGVGIHYWNATCWDNATNLNTSVTRNFSVVDLAPTVNLSTPSNGTWNSNPNVTFFYNVTDNNGVGNCSILINGVVNQTNTSFVSITEQNNFTVNQLTDGFYNWTVNCTDTGDLSDIDEVRRWFYVDTRRPNVNLNDPIQGFNTSSSTVDFNFTATDNLDPTLACNLTLDGSNTAVSANNGSKANTQKTGLTDGQHLWNVSCLDDAGNSNITTTRYLNVSEPPTLSLVAPANNSFFRNQTLNLTYLPTDNSNFSRCTLYLDGVFNQSNTSEIFNGKNNNFTVANLSRGEHNWTVNCTDVGGLQINTTTQIFTVDLANPGVSLNFPADGAQIFTQSVFLNFTATDDIDTNLSCTYTISNPGGNVQQTIGAQNGTQFTQTFTTITDGLHFWNVSCQDDAGNTNISVNRNFTKLNPPTVALFFPVTSYWSNATNQFFNYSATDDNIANCTLLLNGVINQTNATTILSGNVSNFTVNNIPEGRYNWTVNCTDDTNLLGGNVTRALNVDRTVPNVTLLTPSNNTVWGSNLIVMNYTVTDNMADVVTCNLSFDDFFFSEDINITLNNGSTRISNKLRGESSGYSWTWFVTCWDIPGNIFTTPVFNFSIIAPPNATLNSPINNYTTNSNNITFNYTPQDPIDISNCYLYIDGLLNKTIVAPPENVSNVTFVTQLPKGKHNWTMNCTDPDNNNKVAENTNNGTFIIDQDGPSITLSQPASGQAFNTQNIFFNWTPVDEFLTSITCNLTLDGVINQTNITGTTGTVFNTTINNLSLGNHLWNVTCWDSLNNTNTSATISFIVNSPDIVVNRSGIIFNNTNPDVGSSLLVNVTVFNVGGTTSSNFTYAIYDNGAQVGNTQSYSVGLAPNDNVTVNFSFTISLGYHNFTVHAESVTPNSELSLLNNNATETLTTLTSNITSPANNTFTAASSTSFNFTMQDFLNKTINFTFILTDVLNTTGNETDNKTHLTTIELPEGRHVVIVTATDSIYLASTGNITRSKNSSRIVVTVDRTAPVPVINTANNTFFNYTRPTINFTITDNFDSVINFTFYVSAAKDTNGTVNNGTSTLSNLSTLSEGKYQVDLEGLDDVGNKRNATITIYVDITPPSITLNGPLNATNVSQLSLEFNWTASDNLDPTLTCNLTVSNQVLNASVQSPNGTLTSAVQDSLGDGIHLWNVTCHDNASNRNTSLTNQINVSIPTNITLISPAENLITNQKNQTFHYNVTDNDEILRCNVLLDGLLNASNATTISQTMANNITVNQVPDGNHNWTVSCRNDDSVVTNGTERRNFTIDTVLPHINLTAPANYSNISVTTVNFSWIAIDNLATVLLCNLTVDGTVRATNVSTLNGTEISRVVSSLSDGLHRWNVTCWDNATNQNTSTTFLFNISRVDVSINRSDISFNNTSPKEGQLVLISAVVRNLGSTFLDNVTVSFFNGDPDANGTQINGNLSAVNLTAGGNITMNVTWAAELGINNIFVVVDPPTKFNGSIEESNETNNRANTTIAIVGWHFIYGNITDGELVLDSASNQTTYSWQLTQAPDTNIFSADIDSILDFRSLQALGKNTTGLNGTTDFADADQLLNMTGYSDSIVSTYTTSGSPNNYTSYLVLKTNITNVSVAVSINNTNFYTGILWDMSDDSNGEYDTANKEDLVFITRMNADKQGAYGVYDFEMRVPANLRSYKGPDTVKVIFYAEMK